MANILHILTLINELSNHFDFRPRLNRTVFAKFSLQLSYKQRCQLLRVS